MKYNIKEWFETYWYESGRRCVFKGCDLEYYICGMDNDHDVRCKYCNNAKWSFGGKD